MNWDDLKILLALSRAHTLQGAAAHLGVNYTTVSRRIEALQQDTGARLIEKIGRRYVLTSAGEEAAQAAARMEEAALGLELGLLGRDDQLSGTLRVTTIDLLALLYAETFASFTRKHPLVELEVSTERRALDLARRQADVAIRLTNSPPEHLVGRRLMRFDYALYGAESLLARHPEGTPWGELPWLAWEQRLGARVTEAWMARHVPDARIACRVDSATLMLSLVQGGVGLAPLVTAIADLTPGLRCLTGLLEGFEIDVWLLTHEELRHTARVRAFMEHMRQATLQMPAGGFMAGDAGA